MEKNLIVIACSTGGPKALQEVIPYLPKELGATVLIVQHMPSGFTQSLAERLNSLSEIDVVEAADQMVIKPNCCYLAKGGFQMRVTKAKPHHHVLQLTDEVAKYGLRPCADVLFQSLLDTDYEKIISVVLTGMGDDSLEGIAMLRKRKKMYVITQDKETSTIYGMPKVIYEAGYSNQVVPLQKVAEVIIENMEV